MSAKLFNSTEELNIRNVTELNFFQFCHKKNLPFVNHVLGPNYTMDILTYLGFISPEEYHSLSSILNDKKPDVGIIFQKVAKKLQKRMSEKEAISTGLIMCYLSAIVILSNEEAKRIYLTTDMRIIGAVSHKVTPFSPSILDTPDEYGMDAFYCKHFKPLKNSQWERLQRLSTI